MVMLWNDTKDKVLLQLYRQSKSRQVVCNMSVDLEYVVLKYVICCYKTFESSVQLLKSPTVKLFESIAVTFHYITTPHDVFLTDWSLMVL